MVATANDGATRGRECVASREWSGGLVAERAGQADVELAMRRMTLSNSAGRRVSARRVPCGRRRSSGTRWRAASGTMPGPSDVVESLRFFVERRARVMGW